MSDDAQDGEQRRASAGSRRPSSAPAGGGRGRAAGTAGSSGAEGRAGPPLQERATRFLREVVAELRKVIWPTRQQQITYTTVVLVFVTVMVAFVASLDYGFREFMFFVFG